MPRGKSVATRSLSIYIIAALACVCIFALGALFALYILPSSAPAPAHATSLAPAPTHATAHANKPPQQEKQATMPVYPSDKPMYPMRGDAGNVGFQQMGVLVLQNSSEEGTSPTLLPLFGRRLPHNDRWEYYCASDKFTMTRLPVVFENRDCQDDVGCNEIYNGQNVMVPDYGNQTFVARIYKYKAVRM